MNITHEIIASRQRQEEARKLTLQTLAIVYASKKDRSDQHAVSCTCEDCDFVADYDYEQSILHPVSEPEYVY